VTRPAGGDTLLAGAGVVDATPPFPCRLAGYPERREAWVHVATPLEARALVLEQGTERVAIVSIEVMAVDASWTREVRSRASSELGLRPYAIVVAASHTHSAQGHLFRYDGPLGPALRALLEESEGPTDERLRDHLAAAVLEAIREALAALRPAVARVGTADVARLGANRLVPGGPVDPRCLVIRLDSPAAEPIACLVHYACHPTVPAATDLSVTPDFPGAAVRALDASVGGTHLFLNGALGDVSTRDSRREQSLAEVARFGRLLADAARAAGNRAALVDVELGTSVEHVALVPRRTPPDRLEQRIEELETRLERSAATRPGDRRRDLTALEGARIAERLRAPLANVRAIDVEVQVVRFARDLRLVALPIELFTELSARLAEAVAGMTAVVGPANGYLGYIPTAAAFEAGGYEADSSLVEAGEGEMLVAGVAAVIARTEAASHTASGGTT
jgi:hypothetical protein